MINYNNIIKNSIISLIILSVVTIISIVLRAYGLSETSIIIIYIVAVLLTAYKTDTYVYGIVISLLSVLAFNFFFTEPYFSLKTFKAEYPLTLIVMFIASVIISTLTAQVKRQSEIAQEREERINILYKINKLLLKSSDISRTANIAVSEIGRFLNQEVIMEIENESKNFGIKAYYPSEEILDKHMNDDSMKALVYAYKSDSNTGKGTDYYSNSDFFCMPLSTSFGNFGSIGIYCPDKEIDSEKKVMVSNIILLAVVAFERDLFYIKQQHNKMEIEAERVRSNLLRAVSHDIRTPLTGILGSSATIIQNYKMLNDETKLKLLNSIYYDTEWLIHSVENILSITRIMDGKLNLIKSPELAEEIVSDSVSRFDRLKNRHNITVDMSDEMIVFQADGILIEQVIVNLIDNAIKYTPEGTTINVKYYAKNNKIYFELSDNGNGIPENEIPKLFEMFHRIDNRSDAGRKGVGLGLSICKTILDAHKGQIEVYNNETGGATFIFWLPIEENNK